MLSGRAVVHVDLCQISAVFFGRKGLKSIHYFECVKQIAFLLCSFIALLRYSISGGGIYLGPGGLYDFFMTQRQIPSFPLRSGRVHEATGPAAPAFAAICAAQGQGPVLWIRESWRPEMPNPLGLLAFFDPARLLLAQAKDQTDMLAVAEESLRDGAVPLVIVAISRPLDLREGRRLQLAAKAGRATGLCLIGEGMGSNAAETRWSCSPVAEESDSTRMRWEIIKNKTGTVGSWDVRWDHAARRVHVVSPVGKRPGAEGAPD